MKIIPRKKRPEAVDEDEYDERGVFDFYDDDSDPYDYDLVRHDKQGNRLHHTHPMYNMTKIKARRWQERLQVKWETERDKAVKELYERGVEIDAIYRKGVSGLSLKQLRDHIDFHGYVRIDQVAVKAKRATLPPAVSNLLTDDEVLHFGEVTGNSIDTMVNLTIAHALKNIREPSVYATYMAKVIDLMKLKHQIDDDEETEGGVHLHITTRKSNSSL